MFSCFDDGGRKLKADLFGGHFQIEVIYRIVSLGQHLNDGLAHTEQLGRLLAQSGCGEAERQSSGMMILREQACVCVWGHLY